MATASDMQVVGTRVYFLPVHTRVPLKFGAETLTSVTCARVAVKVRSGDGRTAEGWGETPLSVQWVWPGPLPYQYRHDKLQQLVLKLAATWSHYPVTGHALEIGYRFQEEVLRALWTDEARAAENPSAALPWLAALVACSPFDLALHDACGRLLDRPIYETYNRDFLQYDLTRYLVPAAQSGVQFAGKYPADFLLPRRAETLLAWHLVGGLDAVDASELSGPPPADGHPFLLADWIKRDGLRCLKVKLRGTDFTWDFERFCKVGLLSAQLGVLWLSADFNCTVASCDYVNAFLDRLRADFPRLFGMLLYVEQPFPYELEQNRLDVHSVAARKPLFLDESAHDWRMIRLGRELGWTGVALKTCKTQTGALLSCCWARAHGMSLMVQDLTNPMLAQIPHVLLAAHVGTIMGVETNAMQFYPAASPAEEKVHPGLYQRRGGQLSLGTIRGPGFGYRQEEMQRSLPNPAGTFDR